MFTQVPPRNKRFAVSEHLVPIMQCHNCNSTTNVVTGKSAVMPPRVAQMYADPETFQEAESTDDPVLNNCKVEAHIYEEGGDVGAASAGSSASLTPVVRVVPGPCPSLMHNGAGASSPLGGSKVRRCQSLPGRACGNRLPSVVCQEVT